MLLLDEPMSNLDVALRVKMREEIRAIQQKIGITTLFITHDQQEALAISDKIAVMKDGVALQVGTPKEIYNHPNSDFVANFVGTSNCMKRADGSTVFVRPEQMNLTREAKEQSLKVTVKEVKFVGMYYEYVVEAEGTEYRIVESNMGDAAEEWKLGDIGYLSYGKGGLNHEK